MTTLLPKTITLNISSSRRLRNIGIAAHIDAGKTTLTERLLYFAGAIHSCGDVHEGNTHMDFDPIERQKGITISAAAVPCTWTVRQENDREKLFANAGHRFNIIDTPGHIDFTAEVERSLRVLDGVVAVFCGVGGVQPQSETVWRQADRYAVPRIVFVNKMDRTGADFDAVLAQLQKNLRANAWPVLLPWGGGEECLLGQFDVVNLRALRFGQGVSGGYTSEAIPDEHARRVAAVREKLVERLAEIDDEIAALWLESQPVSAALLQAAIRRQTIANRFVPVIAGSAYKYVGIEPLMDAVVQYLPSPEELTSTSAEGALIDRTEFGPLVALAFKQVNDKLAGRLVFVRVYGGVLRKGSEVLNPRTRRVERIGRLVRVIADRREDIASAAAGEICAVMGLRGFATGDTLCNPQHIVLLEPPGFPEPVVGIALELHAGGDQQRLATALQRISEEDPTFRVQTDPETGQCIVAGMGELHLEVIRQKLEEQYGLPTNAGAPAIAYRETVTETAEADYLLRKQNGGVGMSARVELSVGPAPVGEGLVIENRITGGRIPSQFIGAVERGIRDAVQSGVLAGYPVVGVRVIILDGAAHSVDSNDMAFRLAAAEVVREALRNATPVLLEPLMRTECSVPPEYQGDLLGDLNRRRGRVLAVTEKNGLSSISAEVPLSGMFGYATTICSLARGRAEYSMTPARFERVPLAEAAKVLDANR